MDGHPPRREPAALHWRWTALLFALTAVDYLGWLGWDQHYDRHPDGHVSGPYQPWQVIGLVSVLIVVGIAASAWGRPMETVVGITSGLTAAVVVDWSNGEGGETGLWAVGAAMVCIGTLAATAVVAGLITVIRAIVTDR